MVGFQEEYSFTLGQIISLTMSLVSKDFSLWVEWQFGDKMYQMIYCSH